MPKILVKRKAEVFQKFELPPNAVRTNVGTEADNDLVIQDKKVSMNHLQFFRQSDSYWVKDLRSAFGTFLNGQILEQPSPVKHGDQIQIGQHTLIFLDESGHAEPEIANAPDLNVNNFDINDDIATPLPSIENIQATSFNLDLDNYVAQNVSTPRTPASEMAAPIIKSDESVSKTDTFLLAVYGPYTGKKFQLTNGETKIGRDTKLNDIVIRMNASGAVDPSISRRHATITYLNGEYSISDKRSKTRTYVNQHRLAENDKYKLGFGDEIEIVSDQQSTIFRVCHESHLDFSPPRRAGVWWVRFRWPLLRVASVILFLLALVFLIKAAGNRAVVNQVPDKLEITEQVWLDPAAGKKEVNTDETEPMDCFLNTPALGDLNGDGEIDVVFLNRSGRVQVISGRDKTRIWEAEDHIRARLPGQVVLADVNQDDRPDVLLCSATDRLVAIDGSLGIEIWSSSILGGGFAGLPAVADVNGDHRPDVAITTRAGALIVALAGIREPDWMTLELDDPVKSTPGAADITGDGIPEFILGTESGMLYFFQGSNRKIVSKINVSAEIAKSLETDLIPNSIHSPISTGLLDADERPDWIVSTNNGNILALNGVSKKRLWLDSSMPGSDLISSLFLPTVSADLDRDGRVDVVGMTFDGRIRALKGADSDGAHKVVIWEYTPDDWEKFVANPALADFNKDGTPDVVAVGVNHGLYLINGQNGALLWRSDFGGNNPPVTAPVVGDIDHDTYLDVLLTRADKKMYLYQSNARYPAGTILWAQRFANAQHTGNAPSRNFSSLGYNFQIMISLLVILGIVGLNLYWLYQQKRVRTGGSTAN